MKFPFQSGLVWGLSCLCQTAGVRQRGRVGDRRYRLELNSVPLMKPFTQQVMNYLCGFPFSLRLILNFVSCPFQRRKSPSHIIRKTEMSPFLLGDDDGLGNKGTWSFIWTFRIFSCTCLLPDGTITAACGNNPPLLLIPIRVSSQ